MPAIVWRQPGAPPKHYSWMAESGAHKDHLIVSKATGYYIVEKDESVIFLSGTPAGTFCFKLFSKCEKPDF